MGFDARDLFQLDNAAPSGGGIDPNASSKTAGLCRSLAGALVCTLFEYWSSLTDSV